MKYSVKINCNCTGQSAEYQDKKYGKNVRIATVSQKKPWKAGEQHEVRCTCCGKSNQYSTERLEEM